MPLYPRNRKRIFCVGGIFDDFSDVTKSPTKWFETWTGSNVAKSFVSAPGAVGGNALRLLGTIGDGLGMAACGALSPFPNKSSMYYVSPLNPYQWKMKAEFRMRIADDEPDATNHLSHSAGFCLDGAVAWYGAYNQKRTYVLFNVANQKVGIGTGHVSSGKQINIVYSEAWAGSLDTWYDIRIEWEYNWHSSTDWQSVAGIVYDEVQVTVYVNDVQLFSEAVRTQYWRESNNSSFAASAPFGRCGPSIVIENDGGASNGNYVDAYFKDVWITRDVKLIEYEFLNSIISKSYDSRLKGILVGDYPTAINKGMDIQLYNRSSLSDDFSGHFRGIIREAEVLHGKKLVAIEAEGYSSIFSGEKTENHSYTTKTAAFIIENIVNSPADKYMFDTSTYFDAAAATYSRVYLNLPKIDVLMEMASLASFILFLDDANNFHFQNFFTNETDIHLRYGQDKVSSFSLNETFIRQPNFLRIFGAGFSATRQLSEESFGSLSVVYRNINRLDLTTQAAVDEALDYYISAFLEPIKILEVTLRANYDITIGKTIRVTIPALTIDNAEFLVLSVQANNRSEMQLKLMEVRPHTAILLSELNERAGQQEAESFPSDALSGEEVVNIEAVCDCLISVFYQVYDVYGTASCVMSGQGVVTEKGMEFFRDFWEETSPNTLATPNWMAIGDGTTPAKPSDNAMDNELYRISTTRNQDIFKNAGPAFIFGTAYLVFAWGASEAFNCSELGLFDAASSGNCFARMVFPTQALNRQIAGMRIWFKVTPKHGPAFMNSFFPAQVCGYLYNQGSPYNLFNKMDKGGVYGTQTFTVPSILTDEETEAGGKVVVVPSNAAQMESFSMTKIAQRYMWKIEWTYDFAYAERYFTGDGDAPVAWLGVAKGDGINSRRAWIQIFYRTDKLLSEYEGFSFHVVIWLRFLRGNVDPYKEFGSDALGCPKN